MTFTFWPPWHRNADGCRCFGLGFSVFTAEGAWVLEIEFLLGTLSIEPCPVLYQPVGEHP